MTITILQAIEHGIARSSPLRTGPMPVCRGTVQVGDISYTPPEFIADDWDEPKPWAARFWKEPGGTAYGDDFATIEQALSFVQEKTR